MFSSSIKPRPYSFHRISVICWLSITQQNYLSITNTLFLTSVDKDWGNPTNIRQFSLKTGIFGQTILCLIVCQCFLNHMAFYWQKGAVKSLKYWAYWPSTYIFIGQLAWHFKPDTKSMQSQGFKPGILELWAMFSTLKPERWNH